MRKNKIMLGALVASVAMLLTACGSPGGGSGGKAADVVSGDSDALVEAAKAEGGLTLYTVEVQTEVERIAKAFTDEYGIPVQIVRLATGELQQRFSAEADAGSTQADTYLTTDSRIFDDHPDWFAEMTDDAVPGIADYPDNAKSDRSYASLLLDYSIVTNTKDIDGTPSTWEDVLKPKYSDKLLMTDPRSSATYIAWWSAIDDEFGDGFLQKVAALHPDLAPTASTGAQQVAAGEYDVNFPSQPHQTVELEKSGAPIANTVIADPSIAYGFHLAIPEAAPHPNAARLYASWRMTDAGQDAICAGHAVATPISGSERGCFDLPKGWELLQLVGDDREKEILDLLGL